ncbi:hypothetical protein B0T25DRAFT_457525 [Lasiosphaeria hispida]|uniref:Zn(2)-C6 fungal-type domain-containing protein n=1 Tax=Lasiosphaeria hispida TaxID=260671 RepID=A0AAJ0HEA9_9PEZI|nr:hypothetical protein B0T25DRAFT_457525 [Lasiosphaeria hispida]
MQQYPSPTADGTDAHFYHTAAQRDQEMDHQPDQNEHHALASLIEQTEQQDRNDHHDLHELRELRELQEAEATHPHEHPREEEHHTTSVSAEELRLAAQLSQDLAPMMAAAAQSQAQEQAALLAHQSLQLQEHQSPLEEHIHGLPSHVDISQVDVDPDLREQLQAELQSHDQELQNVLPHGAHSEHHYTSEAPSQSHLAHIPLDQQHQLHPGYQLSDSTPPRKRSKVSRACDECRRKKIKCDAQSEASEQPCSNCRRSSAQCLFSRVPQKRGPSKGYIKELADRINTIEGKLGGGAEGLENAVQRVPNEAFSSPMPGDDSRKRPFSSISNEGFPTPTSTTSRVAAWATEHRPIRPYIPDHRLSYTVNDLAPKLIPSTDLPGVSDGALHPPAEGIMEGIPHDGLVQDGLHQDPLQQPEQVREIHDDSFNCYLETIHPTFPVLAGTKARVQSLISQCPAPLQEAFCNVFLDLIHPFLPSSPHTNGDTPSSSKLPSQLESERQRSAVTDLVYLQTLIMMVIAADHRGTAAAKGQVAGPSKLSIIGQAAGLGFSMRLHLSQPGPVPSPELDPDSDDNVALRAWWTLVALDRWNAMGTAMPAMISQDQVVLLPGLKHIVGDAVYNLSKISYILGQLIPVAQQRRIDFSSEGSGAYVASLMNTVMEEFRWQFSDDLGEAQHPVLHLAYWHLHLVSGLVSPTSRPMAVLHHCKHIVRLLASNPHLLSPLNHHFVSLSALALLELTKVDDTRDEATRLVKDILECSIAPSPWNAAVRGKIAEKSQPLTGTGTTGGPGALVGSGNLQQLADLATAVDGSAGQGQGRTGGLELLKDDIAALMNRLQNYGGQGFDASVFLRPGYLTCFEEAGSGLAS